MEKEEVASSVVLIGGSAGGLEIIIEILNNLKLPFEPAMMIVLHRGPSQDSMLLTLLKTKTRLPLHEVDDKAVLLKGNIYLAPADYHVLVEPNGYLSLDASEKINYSRPSIDVTFESAAGIFKKKVVAILLSGSNSDGTNGLKVIKKSGGTCIAQNPETAAVSYMPQNAIENVAVDHVFTTAEIVSYLNNI